MVLHETTVLLEKREGLPYFKMSQQYSGQLTNHLVLFTMMYGGGMLLVGLRRRMLGAEMRTGAAKDFE